MGDIDTNLVSSDKCRVSEVDHNYPSSLLTHTHNMIWSEQKKHEVQ